MKPSDLNLNMSRKTLPEQFALQIEELVQNGALSPGSQLPGERELAQQYSLSRSVIREAIGILHARGLVESRPGKGTFVTRLSFADSVQAVSRLIRFSEPRPTHEHLKQIRAALEPAAAAAAAAHTLQEDLTRLEEIYTVLSDPETPDEQFIQEDLEFHLAVAKASGNPLFAVMIDSTTGILYEFMKKSFAANIQQVREYVLEKHGSILKCIQNSDQKGAYEAMLEHIRSVRTQG